MKKFLRKDNLMPSHSNLEWTEDSVSTVKKSNKDSLDNEDINLYKSQ